MLKLESSHWQLCLEPDVGVQWRSACVRRDNDWTSVVPDCRSPDDTGTPRAGQSIESPLGAANFHMLPYSNRIRDGRFDFGGQSFQLASGARHAIHGALRKLPWQVLSASDQDATCTIDTRHHDDVNWPWPLLARVRYLLDGQTLFSELSLTNVGRTAMPAGMGWHPYFVRNIGDATPWLEIPVTGVYPDANGDCLPDGPPVSLPPSLDFRNARALDEQQRIDCCLSGLSGPVSIAWPNAGLELIMTASNNCGHLVLFNPDAPHFAVEPVTHANDAFNLEARGIQSGVQILEPEETLLATLTLRAETELASS